MVASASFRALSPPAPLFKCKKIFFSSFSQRRPRSPVASLSIGFDDIVELAHNKVLVAATVSATIGQLSKPFTAAIRGDGFNLKSVVQSGGMPSTHSASVVAAATSLGLERGLSDSIFGMSAVVAALVMYDAQGVRREVGKHAKVLNNILKAEEQKTVHSDEEAFTGTDQPGTSSVNSKEIASLLSGSPETTFTSDSESYSAFCSRTQSSISNAISSSKTDVQEKLEMSNNKSRLLNESVGHTEIQVFAGAFLGFIVSLAIDTIL